METRNDNPSRHAGAETEVAAQGAYPQAMPKIDEWISTISEKAHHADELARSLRNYRRAINGPDPERTGAENVRSLDTPPNPSKLVQMDHALKSLCAGLSSLQCEYAALEDLGIVDPGDQGL